MSCLIKEIDQPLAADFQIATLSGGVLMFSEVEDQLSTVRSNGA